jgi:hypothetical protein
LLGKGKKLTEVMLLLSRDTPFCDELRNSEPTATESAPQSPADIGGYNAIEERAGLFIALALTACYRKRRR